MPVRKVSNRGGNVIGHFPSLKMERMIAFESLIERDMIHMLDFEQDVEWFMEQPLTVAYQYKGKTRKYTPDFHVVRNGQDILVECKPEKRVHSDENQRRFAAAQLWCDAEGWIFQVVTDTQLRGGYRLQNVKLLTQFARYAIKPAIQRRVRAFLSIAPSPVTIADVIVQVASDKPQGVIIPIFYMAFHHELLLPLDDAPISVNTPVALTSALERR
jgi:hypothetical protein